MAEFYTSGRTSNEAAFLYQLMAREFGTNNFPDCSNMCHEATSVGLPESIGVGKGTVTLEDFDHCDALFSFGHNPGTNHPRMLTTLREIAKRGAPIIAVNPLRERGLERFTSPQHPAEMLTNSSTPIAQTYYQVKIGGDVALLKGMMKWLFDADAADLAAGGPGLLDRAVHRRTHPGHRRLARRYRRHALGRHRTQLRAVARGHRRRRLGLCPCRAGDPLLRHGHDPAPIRHRTTCSRWRT